MRSTWDENQVFSMGQPLRGPDLPTIFSMLCKPMALTMAAALLSRLQGPRVPWCRRWVIWSASANHDEHGMLIFDEVITGFGRTGSAFASQIQRAPDILTMAKALTNGAQPGRGGSGRDLSYRRRCQPCRCGGIRSGYTYSAHHGIKAASATLISAREKL